MSDCLLWIGRSDPVDVISQVARQRGWTVRTADPEDDADAVASHHPVVIVAGVVDTDFTELRRGAPHAPIAYCPPSTTAAGVAAADAAGVDVILPQDADRWGADALNRRLADSQPPEPSKPEQPAAATNGAGAADTARNGSTDAVAATLATRERTDLRREHERLWTLFENLPDPVVDAEHARDGPVVRAANDAFAEVFGCDREEIVGRPIDDVLASPAGGAAGTMSPEAINEQVREGEVTGAKVRRETDRGARTFLFRGIPYAENGAVRAFGIYTDVTEIERRERHVKVLDRLLRHNLRNDLGVVIGRAENVLDRSESPEIEAEATSLVDAARGLIDLSDTAKRIRRIIEEPTAERSAIPVPELFEAIAVDAHAQFPEATVSTRTAADNLAVLATSDLRVALEEVVENGIVHGSDDSTVELCAEPFEPAPDEWVDLLVVDDGPGIPETERDAVTGERDITQLQHGSGLGLWLVRWAVESVGGDLGFERRDDRTVVRLRLRRAETK